MTVPHSESWLQHVAPRLLAGGFQPLPPESYSSQGFMYAVRRTRFEITKFGMSEAFFVFAQIDQLTPQLLSQFSNSAFRLAEHHKTVPLPCGFFEHIVCYPVAITYQIHPQMADWVRTSEPSKRWAANEMPVAFDTSTGYLCYFEKTPLWGAAYFSGFRQTIEQFLR
ncbi:MAG: hypothetical protein U1A77_05690 [Pirellulales bacterium]